MVVDKLIITAAVNGAEVMRAQTPCVPYTPAEIATAALQAAEAGASIIHVHARHPDGTSTQDPATYQEIIARIREHADVIVQVSTGGAVGMTAEERGAVLTLSPEMATLSTGTVNFGDGVFLNPPAMIEHFAREMTARGVKPEIEVFDTGMVATALRLVEKGVLTGPLHFDFVLGIPGGIPGDLRNLLHLVEAIPDDCTWTAAGIGRAQLPIATAALLLGGHVRVGLEDNIYYRRGELATGSAQLVARIVRLADELGRAIASPAEARQIIGISARA